MQFKGFHTLILILFVFTIAAFAQSDGRHPFHPSDGVYVSTFPDTSSFLNQIFPIDSYGYAEFPIVGKVKVSQMTPQELAEYLRDKFKSYLRSPNIYVKPVIRVSMLGGFARPGLYYADPSFSLWEVVRQAGGTVQEKGIYRMRWERDKDHQKDITRFFENGASLRQMGFQSGDQLWTPSPDAKTFWNKVAEVMPIVTLGITITTLYITYQRDLLLLRSGRGRF